MSKAKILLLAMVLLSLVMPGLATGVTVPGRLRVGLATDLPSVSVSRNSPQLVAESSGKEVARLSSMKIEPVVEILTPAVFRLQVAALKDEGQAHGLAAQLRRSQGESADAVFDAGSDLYKVRVGSYGTALHGDAVGSL